MVTRFYLGESELDDQNVGLGGPSPAFILGTSTLDGDGKLDGADFTTTATGVASLGVLSASAIGVVTPIVVGSADAPLGGLSADVTQVEVTVAADAEAQLGGVEAVGVGVVSAPASAEAVLGGAVVEAAGLVSVAGSADAVLGAVVVSAAGLVSVVGSASAGLGGVSVSASGVVTPLGSMVADLGGLDASAVGSVTPQPSPPAPVVQGGGGGRLPYRRQRRPKVESVVEVVSDVVVAQVKIVEAYCTPIVVGSRVGAVGDISFSGEDDDLQVLLML